MQVAENTVVTFHYRLADADGIAIETSEGSEPTAYLHGHGNILSGLEDAMVGKVPGDSFSITLNPEQAYGLRDESAIQRISAKHLSGAKKWRPGMLATIETNHGPRQVRVVKVGHSMVDVDANHPLAGHTLTFSIDIVEVRQATEEELAHGHAHGAGGHHHD